MVRPLSGTGGNFPVTEDLEGLRASLREAVRRCCPSWLAADAEDIVQEAMLKVLRVLEHREGSAGLPSSYLWRVAYSATVDEIRRRERRREVPMDESGAVVEFRSRESSPESLAVSGELTRGIRQCLEAMAAPRRHAVALRLLGHTVREVAALLRWSYKRAENLVYRGLGDLKRCLSARGLAP